MSGLLSQEVAAQTYALVGWTADRPWALWLLPLLVWVWVWLSRSPRPELRFTGAIRFWQADGSPGAHARERRRWPQPWAVWFACVCLLGALIGPRRERAAEPRTWKVWVDTSPSMYLSFDGQRTRLEVALERLFRELESGPFELGSHPELMPQDLNRSRGLPRALERPLVAQPEVDWSRLDREGWWIVTDHAPEPRPQNAAWVASGGPAVPGPVQLWQGQWWIWEPGQALRAEEAPIQRVSGGTGWPSDWLRLLEWWALERALTVELGAPRSASDALHLEPVHEVEVRDFRADFGEYVLEGRWSPQAAKGFAPGSERFWRLPDTDGSLLAASPGFLQTSVVGELAIAGDRERWGIEWAQRLDATRLLPPEVIPQAERGEAQAGQSLPALPGADANATASAPASSPASPWSSWLALAAGLLLLSTWVSGRQDA